MSTNTTWRYVFNTFESNTRETNIKMLSLSSDTYAKLKNEESNPAIAAILLIYEPVFFAYRDLCEQYTVKSGEYEGTTLGFEEYLDQMPPKLKQWEGIIRAIYNEDTPEEKAIFPNKRVPFESGTYEKRLEALGALKLKTAADPALSAAASLVASFYNASSGARLVQQMHEGALDQLSGFRENQRIILSEELMGVLGQVMFIHRHSLSDAEHYFDLSLLTDTENEPPQTLFSGSVGLGVIANVNAVVNGENLNIMPDTVLRIKNKSGNTAQFTIYSADSAGAAPGAGAQYTLADGQEIEKTVTELGLVAHEFLNIQNISPFIASWEIEILL